MRAAPFSQSIKDDDPVSIPRGSIAGREQVRIVNHQRGGYHSSAPGRGQAERISPGPGGLAWPGFGLLEVPGGLVFWRRMCPWCSGE
jgi:hypothetical protein